MCQMSNSALRKCPWIHWQDDFLLESSRSRLRTAQALWKVVNGDGKWPEVWEYHPTGQPKLSKQSSSMHEWKQVVSTPSTEVISSHNRRSPIISDWSAELLPGCINLMWPFILLHGKKCMSRATSSKGHLFIAGVDHGDSTAPSKGEKDLHRQSAWSLDSKRQKRLFMVWPSKWI